MHFNGWHKSMAHFPSMCCSYPFNNQVLFYDGQDRHFDDREFKILRSHHIQSFTLNEGDSMHYQPNNNVTNLKLNNVYGNARIYCNRNHGTLKFTLSHMNAFLF